MKRTILVLFCFMMVLPLFATGGRQSAAASAPTELIWYIGGSGPQVDTPVVLAEANRYLAEKLNVSLRFVENDFGSYDQRMQLVIASQETYDLCYTASWINNFWLNVSRNAFLPLDDLLNQYAQQLKAEMPPAGWDAAKVSGRIYAVPNQQIWPYQNTVFIEKAYLDRYNINPTTITNNLSSIDSLLALIKRDNPNMFPVNGTSDGRPFTQFVYYIGVDPLVGNLQPAVIQLNDSSLRVVNMYELPETLNSLRMIRDWNQKGYIRPDANTVANDAPDRAAGRIPVYFSGNYSPYGNATASASLGREVVLVPYSGSWLNTSGIAATMTAVSRTSRAPDKAVQFLNLVNTDKYLFNLLAKGIEGRHYTRIDANYIRFVPNSGYFPDIDWELGSQFLAYYVEGQGLNDWEDSKRYNANARPSPALGFSFDSTPVATEMASVTSVVNEYMGSLGTGVVDPDRVMPEFLQRLRNAGNQRIMDELQRQLDAWKARR